MNHRASREVSLSSNFLMVDGRSLTPQDISPAELQTTIQGAKEEIIGGIEAFYEAVQLKNPEAKVSRPSIFSLLITDKATNKKQDADYLSPYGLANRTNVHRHIIEAGEPVEPYWQAAEAAGFTPEIRNRLGGRAMWLALRNPETDPTPASPLENLPLACGFVEPAAARTLHEKIMDSRANGDTKTYHLSLMNHATYCEMAADHMSGAPGEAPRALKQIGTTIAKASVVYAARQSDDDIDRYVKTIKDAEEYAFQMGYDKLSETLLAETKRYIPEIRIETTFPYIGRQDLIHPRFAHRRTSLSYRSPRETD